jgi:imidazoleglycerol-phosphate dehydratase
MSRIATVERVTTETRVSLTIDLDGTGRSNVDTGVGFFDHLLTAFSHHGLFDLDASTKGDLDLDDHHSVEDTALALGAALSSALGDRAGIIRFGDAVVPMDEAKSTVALDLSGRPYTVLDLQLRTDRIGAMTTQNIPHMLEALARTAGLTLHVTSIGSNDHHVAEATFKALGRALRAAVTIDPRRIEIPSSKGAL